MGSDSEAKYSMGRECHGFCDPRGFVSWVDAGVGAGFDFQTRDIQNKPKHMKFGPEMAEI